MSEDKIKKAIDNADSSVSIEKMQNSKQDLEIVKQALESSRKDKSFLLELVKLVEEENKKNGKHKR